MSDEQKTKKDKRISLAPMTFGEAVGALLRVKPDEDRTAKRGKKQPKPGRHEQIDD